MKDMDRLDPKDMIDDDRKELAEIRTLAAAIDRDKIERLRRQSPEARAIAGFKTLEFAMKLHVAGIRSIHPDWTDEQIEEEIRRRRTLLRRLKGTGNLSP